MQDNNLVDVNLTSEMKTSFIDYAMSVIVSRALPDVRDGLKPVHRRILYGMNELGVTPDKPHKKSARITGDVMGKYHPHGDSSIYEAMVRMAQWWSYRYMLVDGHGNFGSMDGDGAAAQRYTEARMSKIALEMLRDINKNTVDFTDNYDASEREPNVLPARFPNLLVNGATGIAVGMATNIPPHNLGESIDAVKLMMDNPDVTTRELMEVLPGPDFPTGALVMGKSGIHKAYETGKGSIVLRSRTEIEETKTGRERIVVTEFPYMVNKTKVHEHIVRLVQEKRIDGITAVRDESNREGVRFVIEVRRDASANVILNNLFKMTQMQTNFGFNMLAIQNGVPKILSLREILGSYIEHQKEVVTRRTIFDKEKAEARAHILEGLLIALDHIDEVIKIIRNSQTDAEAQAELMSKFKLSERQSQAILDMRLRRLTGLERDKIQSEYDDLVALIADLADILAKPERVVAIIKEELDEVKRKFGDSRRTELMVGEVLSLEDEDLIEETNVLITLSNKGYIKRLDQDEFTAQKRGGRGVQGTGVKDDDFVRELVSTSTHDRLLFFTPRSGLVKRTSVAEFANIRQNGLKALNLKDEDELINVFLTDGNTDVIIGTKFGYSVRFKESVVRNMGRSATGVRGVNLRPGDQVVGASVITDQDEVLIITEKGYGKRTRADEYPTKGRGGKGIKTANVADKNGPLAGLMTVKGDEDLMIITNTGVMIRTSVANISQTGRSTMGVKVMRLDQDAQIVTFTTVQADEKDESETETESEG